MGFKRALLSAFFFLSIIIVYAQPNPDKYAAAWKRIDSLINKKGLTESALREVNKLYETAAKEKNDPQLIRTLVYRLSLEQDRSDSGLARSITKLEKELGSAEIRQPSKAIMQTILAGLYNQYLWQQANTIRNRTNTVNFVKSDIGSWTLDDLNGKITQLYLAALAPEDLLWNTPLESYSPIVVKGNVSFLRPTLFDLLAHTALIYFASGNTWTRPLADTYAMNDPALWSDAADFADHVFAKGDTLSPTYSAVRLYQRLIKRHLADKKPEALIDLDLSRIAYVHNNGVANDKEERYLSMLTRLTDRYGALPAAAQAWYLQADHYAKQPGVSIDQRDSTGNAKAVAICEKVIAGDSSEGNSHCYTLLRNLRRQYLAINTEKVNIPNRPFRALVNFRNFSRLYLRLVRVEDPRAEMRDRIFDTVFWKRLLDRPVYRSWWQDLPDSKDYNQHSVEIAISSLPPGNYVLIAGSEADWRVTQATLCMEDFAVSNISYINQGGDYYVLHRESGAPLAGATVQVWNRPNYGKTIFTRAESFTTDEHGHFLLKQKTTGYGVSQLEITTQGDHYFPVDANLTNYSPESTSPDTTEDKKAYEARHAHSVLFTDRAIYRPGQTVYFKGIAMTKDAETHKPKILPGVNIRVVLLDANHQKSDSLDVTTNEFGSYHGVFRLPEHQRNGVFTINDVNSWGSANFSVEEYKRPKFYVEYGKVKDSYRVGDSVRITGYAKAYAGNGIDGAKVVYRVTRRASFRYPWMFWRRPMPAISEAEVAHGELRTDGQGKFSIPFFALPDQQVSPDTKPEYVYEINADITDANGETRSGKTNLTAGYSVVRLSVDVWQGDHLPADSLRGLQLTATNLSGVRVRTDARLAIYPLQAPQRLIRKRLWNAPDRYVLAEQTFLDSFPHDEYRQESDRESWAKGKPVLEKPVAVSDSGSGVVDIPGRTLVPGWYCIEASTADPYGQTVMEKHYIEIYDGKTGEPANPQYSWSLGDGVTVEPGDKAIVSTGSSAKGVFVIRTIERQGESDITWRNENVRGYYTLNKEKKTTELNITEADRGGYGVLDAFVKDNRLYSRYTAIRVPWDNKQLFVRYASYRNKTLPGSEEKWQVTIGGARGEKVSAEVLTAMYDSSLDAFRAQSWNPPYLYPVFSGGGGWTAWNMFGVEQSRGRMYDFDIPVLDRKRYDELLQPGDPRWVAGPHVYYHDMNPDIRYGTFTNSGEMMRVNIRGAATAQGAPVPAMAKYMATDITMTPDSVTYNLREPGGEGTPPPVQARKDFRETAFFFPDLHTDSAGNVSFSFTMPEALTSWKWMTLAHTRDLAFGYSQRSVITQKDLMVQPNAPRFLREGDRMELPVKVVNLSDSELTGQIHLELTDPTTGQTTDGWFTNRQANQYFTVAAHQSTVVGFPIDIPYQYNRPLSYKVTAQARNFSDGEEATLPVVSNRMLVTESLPLNMPGDGTKHVAFDKLLKSGSSETLNHHALTVEFTANPAWYAVQALPYLMEYPYECAEQTFNRAYANALATTIANSSPRLRQVFERWRTADTAALLSNLEKNPELKSILLEETPWVLQGKTETQQKKNIALLFDLQRMSTELSSAIDRLASLQSPDGGFPWFKGGYDDRYITQYILTGIARLQRLNAIPPELSGKTKSIVKAALPWLDAQVRKDYEDAKVAGRVSPGKGAKPLVENIGSLTAQYLYMRSMFNNYGIPGDVLPAISYYRKVAQQHWVSAGKYVQGMVALALFRTGDVQTAKDIMASLKQTAIRDEERGMYWKGMEAGYYWYEAPIEIESLLIEAFREITGDASVDRDLKTWLLRQKQTHNWRTTKATADACYALLMGNKEWLTTDRDVSITLGDKTIDWPADGGEAGTGYNKKVFDGPFVNPAMGNITVKMETKGSGHGGSPAWGAVYWQYFDMLDRITPPGAAKPALRLEKKLFKSINTDRGVVLEPIPDNGSLKPGDKVVVRIVIHNDRSLEYVHLKDMRAACFEPVNVLSQYKWQDGLGYYESTHDASTDFFFGYLPMGTHVFEYTLFTGQAGNFSNGVTSIECMYAPEFAFHSEGIRVNVEP